MEVLCIFRMYARKMVGNLGSVLALGERAKTVDNCFCDAKSTKQGVSVFERTEKTETTMRLDRRRSRRCRRRFKSNIFFWMYARESCEQLSVARLLINIAKIYHIGM